MMLWPMFGRRVLLAVRRHRRPRQTSAEYACRLRRFRTRGRLAQGADLKTRHSFQPPNCGWQFGSRKSDSGRYLDDRRFADRRGAGYQTTQGSGGIGLNPTQQPPRNLPYLLNTDSGGFGPSSQGGFGADGMPFVGGNGGNGGAVTDATVSDPSTTSASAPFATIYDPAIAAAQVETARGAFDPVLTTGSFWESDDHPTGFLTDGFLITPEQLDAAYLRTSITKPLLSGAQVGVAFNNDYYFRGNNTNPALLNPQYQPNAEFGVIQPLLRGFGSAVNEAGIQIAGARANQSDWEFKRRMMEMVRSVESAYWQLYAAQLSLQAIDDAIPLTEEIVRVEDERQRGGTAIAADVGHARSNLLRMRNQRLQAVSNVNQKHLLLRNLLGLPPSDCRPIELVDRPVTEKVVLTGTRHLTSRWNIDQTWCAIGSPYMKLSCKFWLPRMPLCHSSMAKRSIE